MPNENAGKRRRRSQGISRKKELAHTPTATLLWTADHDLFHQTVERKKTKPADLLREIVHDWAVTLRLSGQAKDTMELAGPIRKLHQQIIADELAPVNAALATLLERTCGQTLPAPSANSHTPLLDGDTQDTALLSLLQRLADELENTKEELGRLRAFAVAHYMLSGQTFGVTWATLDFILRYVAVPKLRNDPTHGSDPFQAAVIHRDDARQEGLQMVDQMSLEFEYPGDFEMVLFNPQGVQR